MMGPRLTYWASLLAPLIVIAALAVFVAAVLAEHCEYRGAFMECTLK